MKLIYSSTFFATLLCCAGSEPKTHLTHDQLTGTWIQYEILDDSAYLAIPDSAKSHERMVMPLANFISNIYEFHNDSTFSWYAGLMDVDIGYDGRWTLRNDTIFLADSAGYGPEYLPMRVIANDKLECQWTSIQERSTKYGYWFLEKEP